MAEQKKLKINMPADRAEARYSDFAIIGKNAMGFSFDFGQRMPSGDSISIVSRIAMSPQHAKIFSEILRKNIELYEKNFGEIKTPNQKIINPGPSDKMIHFVK